MTTVTLNIHELLGKSDGILEFFIDHFGDNSCHELMTLIWDALKKRDDTISFTFDNDLDAIAFKMRFG